MFESLGFEVPLRYLYEGYIWGPFTAGCAGCTTYII